MVWGVAGKRVSISQKRLAMASSTSLPLCWRAMGEFLVNRGDNVAVVAFLTTMG